MKAGTQAADLALADAAISRADPAFAAIVSRAGPCTMSWRRGGRRTHFESLASSIVHQQLAGGAAAAIWARTVALVPGRFAPEAVLSLDEDALRGAGLSGAKARAILDLAARVVSGELRLARIGALSDDAVVGELSQVWGVGRWTAEMFLIFQLGRLDVWPTGDLAVRNGYARLHGLGSVPSPDELEARGEAYRPWRSVAAWYCWRAIELRPEGGR
ncbi:MAG TPA: DNA-3-methyladenine glycosylase 2 family protein [Acidimicrobiales bacterium]|nr:DNA-3-methyladenine glycosylase 2 family protein [Acidimicrobiales bacterium]